MLLLSIYFSALTNKANSLSTNTLTLCKHLYSSYLHFACVLYYGCGVAFTFRVRFTFLLWGCLYFSRVLYFHCGVAFTFHAIYIQFIYFTRAIYILCAI